VIDQLRHAAAAAATGFLVMSVIILAVVKLIEMAGY